MATTRRPASILACLLVIAVSVALSLFDEK
jgi:hypothetical protein